MKTSYIINSESISAFVGNKVLFASAGSVRYSKAKEALRNGDDEKFQEALQESEEEVVMEEIQGKGFILEDGQISLDGIPITGPLKLKLDKMIAQEIISSVSRSGSEFMQLSELDAIVSRLKAVCRGRGADAHQTDCFNINVLRI